jgi:hypothetical protein
MDKSIVFYGTLDIFKYVLKHFPKLTFKKFIDSGKERAALNVFLASRGEVVMSHLRVCECV